MALTWNLYIPGERNEPIGISEDELSNLLPAPEEIEKKLSEGKDGEER